ncbi:hypothetical protein FSY45_24750 [Comamonas sp. Z1]|uniref:phage fiber-tail adaptor protein n=1 Tax=Comamonas TaxID=283 RepID=UPI0011E80E6E|nr:MULTISPECIES: hypothetical protein [Comamonas]TYK70277.1 hypothetical protein FSY45_24750 [Comamonas sp. Z1]UBQ44579.1 hypothetical protein LCH15_26180 [Comamonas thiooxydans]
MKLGQVEQQPQERRSYSIQYQEALHDGDSLESASAIAEPAGLVVEHVSIFDEETRVRFWVRGGVSGVTYKVTVTVETRDGERLQDEIVVKVKEV